MSAELRAFFLDRSWGLATNWTIALSQSQADELGITWSPALESLVLGTQAFYQNYGHAPGLRPLLKHLQTTVDETLSSTELQIQLQVNPALVLSYLAGIPRPKQCF